MADSELSLAVVGAGRVGTALGVGFHRAGGPDEPQGQLFKNLERDPERVEEDVEKGDSREKDLEYSFRVLLGRCARGCFEEKENDPRRD